MKGVLDDMAMYMNGKTINENLWLRSHIALTGELSRYVDVAREGNKISLDINYDEEDNKIYVKLVVSEGSFDVTDLLLKHRNINEVQKLLIEYIERVVDLS